MKLNRKSQAGTTADSSTKDDDLFVCQHNAKPNVVCSQSPSLTYVIQVVRMLLDDNRHLSGHIEYMKYKKLTIVSKSYLSQLKWFCLIGWCLAIGIFSAILLLSVR